MLITLHRAAAACAVAFLLVACTSDDGADLRPTPPLESYAAGPCREAAPDLAVLSGAADRLAADAELTTDPAMADEVRLAQERLRALQERLPAGSPLTDPLFSVIGQTGFLRAALASNTYQPERSQDVTTAIMAAEQACTGG